MYLFPFIIGKSFLRSQTEHGPAMMPTTRTSSDGGHVLKSYWTTMPEVRFEEEEDWVSGVVRFNSPSHVMTPPQSTEFHYFFTFIKLHWTPKKKSQHQWLNNIIILVLSVDVRLKIWSIFSK